MKDIEKMSVFYSDMEQIVDGRPQGYYVAPDGFDESYSKQFIENIPAGTTFTFDKYGHYFIQIYYSGKSNDCINITAYNIKDNNFFKLRDLCRILNIYIEWDPVWNMICVDTDRTYIDN